MLKAAAQREHPKIPIFATEAELEHWNWLRNGKKKLGRNGGESSLTFPRLCKEKAAFQKVHRETSMLKGKVLAWLPES